MKRFCGIFVVCTLVCRTSLGCLCLATTGVELRDSGQVDAGNADDGGDDGGACLVEDPCPVTPGGDLYVDGVGGANGPCCCGDADHPCKTLTRAMQLIGAVRAEGVTLRAYNSNRAIVWTASETWPVALFLGTHLEAPNIDFVGNADTAGFCAVAWDAEDTLEVAITGAEGPDGGPLMAIGEPDAGNDTAALFASAISSGDTRAHLINA
jgi:hypothetical protein